MSSIKLSDAARNDLQRLYDFLAQFDVRIANDGIDAVLQKLDYLKTYPHDGSPVEDRPHIRKSVVDFGASGYLVFHKRYERQDTTFVARIIHQKEWYDAETIGLIEEEKEVGRK